MQLQKFIGKIPTALEWTKEFAPLIHRFLVSFLEQRYTSVTAFGSANRVPQYHPNRPPMCFIYGHSDQKCRK
jgi:hypothetical protein